MPSTVTPFPTLPIRSPAISAEARTLFVASMPFISPPPYPTPSTEPAYEQLLDWLAFVNSPSGFAAFMWSYVALAETELATSIIWKSLHATPITPPTLLKP